MADRARLARLRSPPLSAGRATGILPSACGLQVKLTPREFEPHQCLVDIKKHPGKGVFIKEMADRVRFELTVRFRRTHDFQSCAFDHSAIYPTTTTIKHICL